jgi:predicted MPP superfamily phosphohydrolase
MVELNSYTVSSSKLPKDFNLKIAQISDFHNCKLGKEALEQLKKSSPDIIVITGDLIDSRKTKPDIALDFIKEVIQIAPCYYVSGNHEARIKSEYENFKSQMLECGVIVLENEATIIKVNKTEINLIGLADPRFSYDSDSKGKACEEISKSLKPLINEKMYNLVLCHRPEAFDEYAKNGVDLALTGHAHGGQIIIFGIGAVAPNQGIFPKYIKGIYENNGTKMIVSRGIGNSLFPFRLNNRPEIVEINLKGE